MTYNEKKSLYESIMKDVAKHLKQKLNELSITTVRDAYDKKRKYFGFQSIANNYDTQYSEYAPIYKYVIQNKIIPYFDYILVEPFLDTSIDDKTKIVVNIFFYNNNDQYIWFQIKSLDEETDTLHCSYSSNSLQIMEYDIFGELDFEDFINDCLPVELIRILSIRDAKLFVKGLKEQTGINLSYHNFCIYPDEITDELITNDWLNYIRNKKDK